MSVPPEIMQMMSQGGQPPPAAPAPGAGPLGSPMSGPQPAEGDRALALTQLQTAKSMLEIALPKLGSESPEGQAILDFLKKIGKSVGPQRAESELVPAEIVNLLQSLPQAGGQSPEAASLQNQLPQGLPGGMQ